MQPFHGSRWLTGVARTFDNADAVDDLVVVSPDGVEPREWSHASSVHHDRSTIRPPRRPRLPGRERRWDVSVDLLMDATAALLLRSSPNAARDLARRTDLPGLDVRLWATAIDARAQAANTVVTGASSATASTAGDGVELATAVLQATEDRGDTWLTTLARIEAASVLSDSEVLAHSASVADSLSEPSGSHVHQYVAWKTRAVAPRRSWLTATPAAVGSVSAALEALVAASRRGDLQTLTLGLHGSAAGLADQLLREELAASFDRGAAPRELLRPAAALLARAPASTVEDRHLQALQDVFPLAVVGEGLYDTADGACPIGPVLCAASSALARIAASDLDRVADTLTGTALLLALAATKAGALDDELAGACTWVLRAADTPSDPGRAALLTELGRLLEPARTDGARPHGRPRVV